MKAQEILGYLIALKGGGMAAGCAGLTGLQFVVGNVPILYPILWGLAIIGLIILFAGLAIAASAEGAD